MKYEFGRSDFALNLHFISLDGKRWCSLGYLKRKLRTVVGMKEVLREFSSDSAEKALFK